MKILKLLTILVLLGTSVNGNAQFWKKLSKKAQVAAEDAISRKVEEKAARETEKTFDTVFNNEGKLFKTKKVEKLDNYSFTHQYVMEVISKNDTTDIIYYLTNEHEYMGSSFTTGKDQEFITVMDLPNGAIHTFMDFGDQKTTNSIKIPLENVSDGMMNTDKFSVVPTGQTKTILGYECEKFEVTGPQLSGIVWVTQDAGISFQKAFSNLKSKKMKLNKGAWTNPG